MGLALLINAVLFVLSFLSGMLGLGVAFVAIPVLGLFGFELKHESMPWALLLNGLTAISAAVSFTRKKMVDFKTGVPLVVLTTAAASVGVYLVRFVETTTIWWLFVAVLAFLAVRMAIRKHANEEADVTDVPQSKRALACVIGTAIGVFAGPLWWHRWASWTPHSDRSGLWARSVDLFGLVATARALTLENV